MTTVIRITRYVAIFSLIVNFICVPICVYKFDKIISKTEFMSFCMKFDIKDKDCKIPYQIKRTK